MPPTLGRLWRGWRLLSIIYTLAEAGSEPLGKVHYPSHPQPTLSSQLSSWDSYFLATLEVYGHLLRCDSPSVATHCALRTLTWGRLQWGSNMRWSQLTIIFFLLASDYFRTEYTNFLPDKMMWNPMKGAAGKSFSPEEECPPILLPGSWTAILKSWGKKRVSRQSGLRANSWDFDDLAELSQTWNHLL